MTDTPKDNRHILDDPEAFKQVIARARAALGKIPGVVSVGVGQKATGGSYRDDIAIVVVVETKKPDDQVAPAERIPPLFEGFRTDVTEVQAGDFLGCNNTTFYDTIQGGIQIMPTSGSGTLFAEGTLGCIVRRRGDPGRENVYLLTNAHVLYSTGAQANDYVYHPFASEALGRVKGLGPIQPDPIRGNVSYRPPGATADIDVYLDCGIARIDLDSKCFGSTCTHDVTKYDTTIIDLGIGADDPATPSREDNMIADVRNVIDDPNIVGHRVYKVGRTTGRTAGIVRATADAIVPTHPHVPAPTTPASAQLKTLIRIDFDTSSTTTHVNCAGDERFADHADSGALVVDEQGRAIGVVALGPERNSTDPPPRAHPVWACHILPILDRLGICIPTRGGTSHGSCGALDGSGITGGVDFEPREGDTLFASAAVLGVAAQQPPAPPPQLTDAQRERLLAFRDQLRQTAFGRALHDTFGDVRREIGYLVRNSRPVKVAWSRAQGPAFFAHMLKHLRGDQDAVPFEIEGVSRAQFLQRVGAALAKHGSNPLRAAIERYGPVLLPLLSDAVTVDECLERLRRRGDP